MKFDSNRAWQQATASISANREVLIALSGVFFLLPTLAFSLLFPQPPAPAGMDQQASAQFMLAYYSASVPYMIPVTVLQAAGVLALLTLLTDRRRPTVGEAIRIGGSGLLPYLGSQLLLGLAAGLLGALALTVAALSGSKALVAAVLLAMLGVVLYVAVRTSLSAPVIAVDGVRNPITALSRSWRLTAHNALRITVFYALILLAFAIVLSVVTAVAGLLLALVLPAGLATIVVAVLSAALGAAMALTFVAVLAAVHAQLAGEPSDEIISAF